MKHLNYRIFLCIRRYPLPINTKNGWGVLYTEGRRVWGVCLKIPPTFPTLPLCYATTVSSHHPPPAAAMCMPSHRTHLPPPSGLPPLPPPLPSSLLPPQSLRAGHQVGLYAPVRKRKSVLKVINDPSDNLAPNHVQL